ncbi:uncharacterized protein LOC130052337 isoform X2 [Ostrea edulis]|uniref:uncharacterized protein LOC130052337 isoform X2 n=1 Tax=Ostrea edulis TaxID=37623 RepID=UPI0024AF1580|nr:uncharacterized protein LOC130052337 isoform X2 [Ostrea edulis]
MKLDHIYWTEASDMCTKVLCGLCASSTSQKNIRKYRSKKTATNNEDGNDKKDVRGSVKERHHPYEECHPEDDDNKADPGVEEQFKVARAPRQYEDIDKDFDQEKSETKDSSNSSNQKS